MLYRSLLILGCASVALFSGISGAGAETLEEAVATALATHPSVDVALATRAQAEAEKSEAISGYFPQFNTYFAGGRIFGNNSTSRGLAVTRGEAYSYLWEGSASLTQPIFDGMETINKVDAARARIAANTYNVSDARENLALRAVQSYLNLLRTEELVEKTKAYTAKAEDYYNRIQGMVGSGGASEAESTQAKNILLMLENMVADFEGQKESALAEYAEIVGRVPDSALVKPAPNNDKIPATADEAVAIAKQEHPMVLATAKELEAAEYSTDAEAGTLYPDLNGELSYLERDQIEELGGESVDARALLRISWNFETGGGALARIRKKKAEYSQTLARGQENMRNIIRDVRQSYAALDSTQKQLDLLRERVGVTQSLFDTYESQFEGARVTLLQLMQADNQLFNTRLEEVNADYRMLAAKYTILASMGKLQNSMGVDAVSVVSEMGKPESTAETTIPREETVIQNPVYPPAQNAIYPAEDLSDSAIQEDYEPVQEMTVPSVPQENITIYPEVMPMEPTQAIEPVPAPVPDTPVQSIWGEPDPVLDTMSDTMTDPEPAIQWNEPAAIGPKTMQLPMPDYTQPQEQIYPPEDYHNAPPALPAGENAVYP